MNSGHWVINFDEPLNKLTTSQFAFLMWQSGKYQDTQKKQHLSYRLLI